MLPLKGSNRLNYIYSLWLNLPENCIITLSTTTQSRVHSKLTEGRWQNSSWTFIKDIFKGTLTQNWKSANIVIFVRKQYVENFTLKHLLLFEICVRKVYEKFVYKHSETIEYVKNQLTFLKNCKLHGQITREFLGLKLRIFLHQCTFKSSHRNCFKLDMQLQQAIGVTRKGKYSSRCP